MKITNSLEIANVRENVVFWSWRTYQSVTINHCDYKILYESYSHDSTLVIEYRDYRLTMFDYRKLKTELMSSVSMVITQNKLFKDYIGNKCRWTLLKSQYIFEGNQ